MSTALKSVPANWNVTNPGKEAISLAGMTTIPPGKTVNVNLTRFRPVEDRAAVVYMALASALHRGHITGGPVETDPAVVHLMVPDVVAGRRVADLVQPGAERKRPSTGLGSAGADAVLQQGPTTGETVSLRPGNVLEAVKRPLTEVHNPTEPAPAMGSRPAKLDREAPPAPPAAPPAAPVAPPPPPPPPAGVNLADL